MRKMSRTSENNMTNKCDAKMYEQTKRRKKKLIRLRKQIFSRPDQILAPVPQSPSRPPAAGPIAQFFTKFQITIFLRFFTIFSRLDQHLASGLPHRLRGPTGPMSHDVHITSHVVKATVFQVTFFFHVFSQIYHNSVDSWFSDRHSCSL